jgi:hypothetical protein
MDGSPLSFSRRWILAGNLNFRRLQAWQISTPPIPTLGDSWSLVFILAWMARKPASCYFETSPQGDIDRLKRWRHVETVDKVRFSFKLLVKQLTFQFGTSWIHMMSWRSLRQMVPNFLELACWSAAWFAHLCEPEPWCCSLGVSPAFHEPEARSCLF